ncbi:MAG: FAD-binding protein [Mycobacteriaceae bacterium]|nr:FAD-binding protein [Mycobacteriaceae bacterium]
MEHSENGGHDRRRFLAYSGAAAAAVIGFDALASRWVTPATAQGTFDGVPPLDGTLTVGPDVPADDAHDQGNIVFRRPAAVLRPRSTRDVARMVAFCARHGIEVAARGAGHSVFGQGLVTGLLIDMRSLRTIHSIGAGGADVDAGVLWRDLLVQAFHQARLTPPVLTGYVGLTVGGTLAVGGVDGNTGVFNQGLQTDHVRSLEVVTGSGDIVRCSPHAHRELFEAVLGGLGQFGIVTRATVDLAPAKPMVRVYRIHYTAARPFFRDLRVLLDRGEVDGVYNLWMPNGTTLLYELTAFAYFDPAHPPDDRTLLRGLGAEAALPITVDLPYLTATQFVDDFFIAPMQTALGWDRLVKPWFDVWLPDDTVEQFVEHTLSELGPDDVGPGGFVLLIPQRRSAITRPFVRVPTPRTSDWIYLFDLLSASLTPNPDPGFAQRKLARNRRLYDRAVAAGGTRYPISAIEFGRRDWQAHYGDAWPRFTALKRRYDPHGILTPGVGIR